ncbi:hypothetical protein NE237_019494 [Protea cynaroides]|uniref:Uncharacterized protein n=1 Tax=Protea cynaroides TaxID=273540 RepID=A0A9Q0GLQ4_9MAGN|nr:hypothetical protein NE237_019494 [Protea cynaroides]
MEEDPGNERRGGAGRPDLVTRRLTKWNGRRIWESDDDAKMYYTSFWNVVDVIESCGVDEHSRCSLSRSRPAMSTSTPYDSS